MIGLRQMRANPGFTLLVTLVLGLGISLVITLASVLDAVYFKPVPYPDSERLIHLEVDNVTLGYRGLGVTAADFLFWRENNPVFEDLAAYRPPRTMLLATGGPEPLALSGVSPISCASSRATASPCPPRTRPSRPSSSATVSGSRYSTATPAASATSSA
jgi:hypothetical protein